MATSKRTYKAARIELFQALLAAGWSCSAASLKVLHATHPGGYYRVWFRAQAVHASRGTRHLLGDALSLWIDVREVDAASFVAYCNRLAVEGTGCTPCGCRDCFEAAIGAPGALCWACREAGCDGGECLAPGAYGGEDDADHAAPDPGEKY